MEKRCFNQRSREITTVRRCEIIPFRQITRLNKSRSNCMRTLLNENLVLEVRQSFGRVQCRCFPRTRAVELCSGTTFNQWLQPGLVFFFSFSSCTPDCVPEARGDAPAVSSGSLTDPAARGEGARLPARGSSAAQQSKPATGSAGEEHWGSSSGSCGCSQLQRGKNGDRSI